MKILIEDAVEDVVGKAQSGQGISDGELAEQTGIERNAIRKLRKGAFDADTARGIAANLGLDAEALVALGEKSWYPESIELEGLVQFNAPFPVPGYAEMTVNSYLIGDPETGLAAAFDTGPDAKPMLETLQRKGWTLHSIFLTHTHKDHIADLNQLKTALEPGGLVYVHDNESLPSTHPIRDGLRFQIGNLDLTARETSGHSPGGTSFIINGLERPIAVVGDALFAGSIGGVRANYRLALKMIRERILNQSVETVICPGHGPMTTVGNELQRNAFFASLGA